MVIETITIPTIAGITKTPGFAKVSGSTFTHSIGGVDRKFIIHKGIRKQDGWVLTDVNSGSRIAYLSQQRKNATLLAARSVLCELIAKHGAERMNHVFHNADLTAGLPTQIH